MDIIKFEQFIKVCETGNLTKAAEELFVTQPALSQSIASFEEFFEHKLFDRDNKKMTLNANGKIALKHSRDIIGSISDMRSEMEQLEQDKNVLNVCSSDINVLFFVMTDFFVSEYKTTLRQVDKGFSSYEEMLIKGKTDIIISTEHINKSGIRNILLFEDRQMVLTPKGSPMFGKRSASLMDFVGCEFIRGTEHNSAIMSVKIDEYLKTKRPELGLVHYLDSHISRKMKYKGNYHSFMSTFGMYNYGSSYKSTSYKLVTLTDKEFITPYYLSYRVGSSETVNRYLTWLKENYAEIFGKRKCDFEIE